MSGPYFSGQVPTDCGHHSPDVLRLRDEKRPDGSIVRISDCRYCGRSELVLEAHTLDKGFVRRLNKTGGDVGIREEDLAAVTDRRRAEELLDLIVERVHLQHQSRGGLDWTYGGKSYPIAVVKFEHFEVSAFRLHVDKPKRKRAEPRRGGTP